MSSELKPCRFCGKTNISVGYDSGLAEVMRPAYFAVCRDCGARGPCRPTDDGAIAAWNNRVAVAESATTTGDGAKMREALNKIAHYDESEYSMDDFNCADGHVCADIARAALAAPPRNCDTYRTKDEAREAFQRLRGHKVMADVSLWDDRDEIENLFDWLLAIKGSEVGVAKMETTTQESLAVGDGAKMREALESISVILKGFDFDNQNAPTPDDLNCVHNAIGIAEAALAAPPKPQGNVAKMREALEKARSNFNAIGIDALDGNIGNRELAIVSARMVGKIDAALAAPPRNCDRFQTTKQAKKAYCTEVRRVFMWDGCETERLVDWLLATAESEVAK